MKTPKTVLSVALILCLLLSLGIAAYAASDFSMSYYPGTDGTVTNMPENDSGTGGETYTVSSTVPRREGYAFLGWELGWEEEDPPTTSVTIRYCLSGTDIDLVEPTCDTGLTPGKYYTAYARVIEGYIPDGETSQTILLSADESQNIIIFYYLEARIPTEYTVKCVLLGTEEDIIPPETIDGVYVGDKVTERRRDLSNDGYIFAGSKARISITLKPDPAENVIIFEYTVAN